MKKHWSARYIFFKALNKYRKSKEGKGPWLPYDCVKFLKQYLSKGDIFLETGSGNSTLWFSKFVKEIVSIEHNKEWFKFVSERIDSSHANNIRYFFASNEYKENPGDSAYVQKVASFQNSSFDAILVDGKHRSEVAAQALEKVKETGIIIVDNVERYLFVDAKLPEGIKSPTQETEGWIRFKERTKHYRRVVFSDGITSTIIFFVNKK